MDEGIIKNYLNSILPSVLGFFWSVILALIIFWVGRRVIRAVVDFAERGMKRRNIDAGVQTFTRSLITASLYILLALIILGLFGVSTSSVAAAVAALGLTAGLSLQGSLSNFAGGVLILILKPFVVGDYISEATANKEGTVTEITIFYTKLLTIDEKVEVIPNGNLSNASITNYTAHPTRQMRLIFPISYEDDIKAAKNALYKLAEDEPRRVPDTEIKIFVSELNESSVDLELRFFVKNSDYWPVRWDCLEAGKYALESAGCTIPFKQVDVNLKK